MKSYLGEKMMSIFTLDYFTKLFVVYQRVTLIDVLCKDGIGIAS